VDERCAALGAATAQDLIGRLKDRSRADAGAADVVFRGFLKPSPRLISLGAASQLQDGELAQPRALIAADESDELERIARWCKRQVESRPEARILIVLPGSPGTRERLATLIRQTVNPRAWLQRTTTDRETEDDAANLAVIEGGGPFARVPVIAHALATLQWLGGAAVEFDAFSEWLRAPHWHTPSAGGRARIDLWLREKRLMNMDVHAWVTALNGAPAPISQSAQELAQQLSAAATALGDGNASPREWSERFRAALGALQWPGDRARDSGEQQTVVRFHELLDEFGQLALAARSLSRESAIHWFSELASRTTFQPSDDDAVVTISQALADPVVLYDAIWVAGLHAEALPQPVQPDPFLPLAAQLQAGVPAASASGRLAEARALVTAWRAATNELVLSAPARVEDLDLLPSPLLTQWLPATQGADEARESSWLATTIHRAGMLEGIDDSVGVPWPLERPLPGGTRSLELQNLCAFRAYAELRLGGTVLGAPEPGVAPDLRGQLLHVALQKLWQQLKDSQTLAEYSGSTLDALIERSVSDAAEAILGQRPEVPAPPMLIRECRRAVRLVKTLCELERERSAFRVQHTELETTATVSGARMSVRIDRLDTLEDGGRAILDYKSGMRTSADWYGERPSHPQLLAYLAAMGGDAVAMATVNVTAREVRFEGIAHSPHILPKVKGVESPEGADAVDAWQYRKTEWLARVERLAADFLAGRATVDPKPNACDYCHVVSVCRIGERRSEEAVDTISTVPETSDG
jgi:probable DNA repair protein